jgi:hypothetical protein
MVTQGEHSVYEARRQLGKFCLCVNELGGISLTVIEPGWTRETAYAMIELAMER